MDNRAYVRKFTCDLDIKKKTVCNTMNLGVIRFCIDDHF